MSPAPDRRGFVAGLTALVLGGLSLLTPVASAVVALFDPIHRRRSSGKGNRVEVTTQEIADRLVPGVPESFTITGTRKDAWNTLENQTIGSVFLVRDEAGKLRAFQSKCPHQGCDVSYLATEKRFFCPCHNANFQADGARVKGDEGPVCRDLDSLDVEVRDGAVWVDYKTFRTGIDHRVEA
jgi:menaquinol-cytochrome c reductase iron-sulfur subunit